MLRRKALADPEATLEKILPIAKAVELSELQAEGIESANRLITKAREKLNERKPIEIEVSLLWLSTYSGQRELSCLQEAMSKMPEMESF